MTTTLGHARLIGRPTVHVVRSVDRGRGGPVLASLCGHAVAPLEEWAERTWTTIEGQTGTCDLCTSLAGRRTPAA